MESNALVASDNWWRLTFTFAVFFMAAFPLAFILGFGRVSLVGIVEPDAIGETASVRGGEDEASSRRDLAVARVDREGTVRILLELDAAAIVSDSDAVAIVSE